MKMPTKVFITYSHKNTAEKERLETALAVMKQNNEIEIWSDAKILAGDRWEQKIAENLKESDILLYLVSAYSLASVNCNKELTDRFNEASNIPVIPIILDDCDFLHHPLSDFHALPTKNKDIVPISNSIWSEGEAWKNVVEGIRKKIKSIPCKPTQGGQDIPPPTPKESQSDSLTREQVMADLLNRANFFLMLGNNDLAIANYSKAIEINSDYVAYNNRGIVYGHRGDNDLAIADYDKAIELNPNNAVAYSNRGNIYRRIGDNDRAIADYNKAIELNPNDAVAYNNRGIAYVRKGDSASAIVDFNKAIDLNLEGVAVYNNRGNAYDKIGDYGSAIADYNKAIELNPKDAVAYSNRGGTYGNKGNYDLALADYKKAIEMNPNYVTAYFNLGITKKLLKDYKGAKGDLETALRLAEQQGDKALAAAIREELAILPPNSD